MERREGGKAVIMATAFKKLSLLILIAYVSLFSPSCSAPNTQNKDLNELRDWRPKENAIGHDPLKRGSKEHTTEYNNDYYLKKAMELRKVGQYEQALVNINKAIDIKPTEGEYNIRGLVYSSLDNDEKAIDDYDKAIKLNPDRHIYYFNKGFSCYRIARYDEAINSLQKCISLNNRYAMAHEILGLTYSDIGRYDDALKEYNEAFKYEADKSSTYIRRGWSYLFTRQPALALEDAKTALLKEKHPEHANNSISGIIGYLSYLMLRRHEEAISFLKGTLNRYKKEGWTYSCIRYLLGEVTADQLLSGAGDSNFNQTDAHSFIALKETLYGRKTVAEPHSQWLKTHGVKRRYAYIVFSELTETAITQTSWKFGIDSVSITPDTVKPGNKITINIEYSRPDKTIGITQKFMLLHGNKELLSRDKTDSFTISGSNHIHTRSFTIPTGAKTGEYQVRIRSAYENTEEEKAASFFVQ